MTDLATRLLERLVSLTDGLGPSVWPAAKDLAAFLNVFEADVRATLVGPRATGHVRAVQHGLDSTPAGYEITAAGRRALAAA